ncbi:MAG: hypothetical protein JNK12_02425 [Acidimicrobiales bacterium]|nr:hypothetical protein [Acidimicrobiales bacterium]
MAKDRRYGAALVALVVLTAGSVGAATPVSAGAPATGTVRGRVTAEATGAPLQGACVVFLFDSTRGFARVAAATTGANGYYRASVPAGSAVVVFEPGDRSGYGCYPRPPLEGYAGEVSGGGTDPYAATLVAVTGGQTVEGIDAALSVSSHLTGTVTAEVDGAPLEGICVEATHDRWVDWLGTATTDADGHYDIATLTAGDQTVAFWDCTPPIDHVGEFFDDQARLDDTNVVPVGVASTTSGIDATLAIAGHISGRLTDDATGGPVVGGRVTATRLSGPPGPDHPTYRFTDTTSDGTYDVGGLPEGSYALDFESLPGSYVSEDHGAAVVVAAGGIVDGIDAGLTPACRSRAATVDLRLGEHATNERDVIRGTSGADVIVGLRGGDLVCGMGGPDQIRSGRGTDEVYGDEGDDEVRGGRGDDVLYGGDGRWGDGDGDDLIVGGAGADHLVGGDGTDDCRGESGLDTSAYCDMVSGVP